MSYDELTKHATTIKDKAISLERRQTENYDGTKNPPSIDSIRAKYAFIEPLFAPWSQLPNPAKYDPLIADLRNAMQDVSNGQQTTDPIDHQPFPGNPKLDKMTTAGGYLQHWTGQAAITFKANFVDTFKTIATNQFILLATMKGALEAEKAMWQSARADIDKISHATLDAFDNVSAFGKNQWALAFAVTSAVAAVGGVVATAASGGITAPLAFSAIGAAASVGNTGVANENAKVNGGGNHADDITNSMKQAMGELATRIQETEEKVAKAVQGIIDQVGGHRNYFVAARPNIADLKDGDLVGEDALGTAY